jgi:hypothetical protein
MPFRLQGAPVTFQRIDDAGEFAAAYLDDVVIHSANWDDHVHHVREVLQHLQLAGLIIKPKKCQCAMSQCTYLGHVVRNGEVRPEMSKVNARNLSNAQNKETGPGISRSHRLLPEV